MGRVRVIALRRIDAFSLHHERLEHFLHTWAPGRAAPPNKHFLHEEKPGRFIGEAKIAATQALESSRLASRGREQVHQPDAGRLTQLESLIFGRTGRCEPHAPLNRLELTAWLSLATGDKCASLFKEERDAEGRLKKLESRS